MSTMNGGYKGQSSRSRRKLEERTAVEKIRGGNREKKTVWKREGKKEKKYKVKSQEARNEGDSEAKEKDDKEDHEKSE